MQDGDASAFDQFGEIDRILMSAGTGDDEPCTERQRPEELPHRDVEAERGFLHQPVVRCQLIGLLHPLDAVDDAAMAVHHALGPPGRARGVDHISQVACVSAGWRRRDGMRGDAGPVGVEPHKHRVAGRQPVGQRILGEQHQRLGVGQHEGEPLGGIVRVERQVGAAGLEDTEQPDHHLERALGAYSHHPIRPDAEAAQAMRELVGAALEFAVT